MRGRPETDLLPIGEAVAIIRRSFPEVTHSSLRFLEREGLLEPARTPGGHRLFTPADIDRILQIKEWQAGRLSLDEIRRRLAARHELELPAVLAERWLEAALGGDPMASRLVLHAHDLGLPLVRLFQEVLQPALIEIGRRPVAGGPRLGQQQEVTEIARELIAGLAARQAPPAPTGRAMLAACVAGEHHDLGLRMIVALLRGRGRLVQFFGANVDTRFLQEEVRTRRPAVVLLSATMAECLPTVRDAAAALHEAAAPDPLTIIVGGQAVRGHQAALRRWGVVPAASDDLAAALRTILAVMEPAVPP